MHWSIRTKILAVISLLLLMVVFAYLVIADHVFREDKELLVFDTNRSNTEQLSNELDGDIRRVTDKMAILSQLLVNDDSGKENVLAKNFFEQDPDLVVFQLIFENQNKARVLQELSSETRLKQSGILLNDLKNSDSLPTKNMKHLDYDVFVDNRSQKESILYLVRIPIKIKGFSSEKHVYAQSVVNGKNWLPGFQNESFATTFAVTGGGVVFAHPQSEVVLSREDMSGLEIVKSARANTFVGQQLEFKIKGKQYVGVYRKTSLGGLIVISITDKNAALVASRLLLEKAIILSLLIITLVFIVSVFFTSSISNPLLQLVKATREIARGYFDTKINVKAKDEIGVLAEAFERMAQQLKTSRLQLEDYNRSLELKVQERTQELASKNAAIREQQDILLRTTRLAAVGEISGQAAHEVLNPLTGMIARLETVASRLKHFYSNSGGPISTYKAITNAWKKEFEKGGAEAWLKDVTGPSKVLPEKTLAEEDIKNLLAIATEFDKFGSTMLEDINILASESHRIGRIVEGIRGLSRTSGIKARVNINELIAESIKLHEDLLNRYKISVDTRFWGGAHLVNIDRDEILQVFSNLIKNSTDAIQDRRNTPANERAADPEVDTIRIEVREDGSKVKINFWDNGIGILSEYREKIFQMNFSTKGNRGTGFGLSISRRFVREAGGDLLLVDSKPGQFTEFEINLPRLAGSGEEEAHARA